MDTTREAFERGRRFILQRARPIEVARWRFFFEGSSAEQVLDLLSPYQNSDGGFGHALEPDFWNPHSSPIQTWAATEILRGLDITRGPHPIIEGILGYLDQETVSDDERWTRTIPTNNDYPHAPWWAHGDLDQPLPGPRDNPAAALAGFALEFSARGSHLWDVALKVARETFSRLLGGKDVEVHALSCLLRLFETVTKQKIDLSLDLSRVQEILGSQVNSAITRDTSLWSTGYVCRPSRFIHRRDDRYLAGNEELVREECEFLKRSQREDGSWPVNWSWSSYPDEWPVAREWWKSIIVIENLQFLREFDS